MVSGHEAVMVTVQAPSGTKSLLPLALEDGAGRYTAALTCSEVPTVYLHTAALPRCNVAMCSGPHMPCVHELTEPTLSGSLAHVHPDKPGAPSQQAWQLSREAVCHCLCRSASTRCRRCSMTRCCRAAPTPSAPRQPRCIPFLHPSCTRGAAECSYGSYAWSVTP